MALLFMALSLLALNRLVAADEGFYLMAAKLVSTGQHPYIDFFYPQMPFLPYVYSLWSLLFDHNWYTYRLLTALLSSGLGTILFVLLWNNLGKTPAIFGTALLLSNGLFLGWFSVCKTYSLEAIFFLAAVSLIFNPKSTKNAFAAGLLLGLAIDVRLFYLALTPVFLMYMLWKRAHQKACLAFCAGGLIAALPHLYYLLFDLESYWFSNIGYHLNRSYRPPEEDEQERFLAFLSLTGLTKSPALDGVQFPSLLYSCLIASLIALYKNKKEFVFISVIVLTLGGVYLIPTPTHLQYFATLVPYLVIGATFLFSSLYRTNSILGTTYALCMLCISILPLNDIVTRFTRTGEGVKAIGENTIESFSIPAIQEVSKKIDQYINPDDIVLAQWPGFLLESKARPYPGAENQFWVRAGSRLSEEQRQTVHVVSHKEFRESVFLPKIKFVVLLQPRVKRFVPKKYLRNAGFTRVDWVNRIYLYDRTEEAQLDFLESEN